MATTTLKKKDSFFSRNRYVFISALCAAGIMVLVYYCYDLIPFGDKTVLRMDLYHQYGPMFAELYDRLTSGGSLLYSWESGLGSSFLGNFLNYLSSPLSILILFFGHENITEAISLIIFLKAALSAAAFTYYIKSAFGKNDISTAAFGILYAFCGYFVAYYWNVMWLDAMYLFPLVMLGIERIIQKGRPSLYCVTLAFCFITNYYMAYMICVFSVLYFLTYYFSNYPLTKKFCEPSDPLEKKPSFPKRLKNSVFFCSGWKFAFSSLLAVGLVSVLLFPVLEVLSGSSATTGSAPVNYQKYFSVFDFLANHLAAVEPTIRSSGSDVMPNVYCGILTVILVPLYLFCSKIPVREKISYVCLLAVLYFSFDINFLNFFWHGFHFPNDLPYRFSFMYSFVLLQMAYKAFLHLRAFTMKQILGVGVALLAFLVLVEEITAKNIDNISLALSLAFTVVYVLVLYVFKNKRYSASVVSFLLLCTVVSEIALSNTNKYSMNQSKTNYTEDYEEFRTLKEQLDAQDDSFYRMELTNLRTRMDPSWYNYNGVSVFSSMAYESVAKLQQDLGMFGNNINSYTYYPQTPIYNAMFGLKYIVENDGTEMSPEIYKQLFSSGKFTAYENLYSLPVAFACDAEVSNWLSEANVDPFLSQQAWFRMATGVDSVFEPLAIDYIDYNNVEEFLESEIQSGIIAYQKIDSSATASFTFELTPAETGNVYIYVKSANAESASISSNLFFTSIKSSDGYILDLGERKANETIFVDIPIKNGESEGMLTFYAYTLNADALDEGYETLADGGLQITEYGDTYLRGTLTAGENEIVYTSIPYDDNWHVYVDGKRLFDGDLLSVSGSLLAFRIGAGTHEISLCYDSAGLRAGSFISCISITLAAFLVICRRREWLFYKKQRTEKWDALCGNETASAATESLSNSFISEYLDLDIIVEDEKADDHPNDKNS